MTEGLGDFAPDAEPEGVGGTHLTTRAVAEIEQAVPEPLRAFDRLDDLEQSDLLGRTGEGDAAPDTAFGMHDAVAGESAEDLGQVGFRDLGAAGDVGGLMAGAVGMVETGEGLDGVTGGLGKAQHAIQVGLSEVNPAGTGRGGGRRTVDGNHLAFAREGWHGNHVPGQNLKLRSACQIW